MPLKIVGAGFGRTGTMSMKYALEQIGFGPCYHMIEVANHPEHIGVWQKAAAGEPVNWSAVFDGYQAAVDWPACNYWRDLLHAFPNAKVLLTLRDADAWYESVMNTIWPVTQALAAADDEGRQAMARMSYAVIWDCVFGGRIEDRDHAISVFNAHNQAVIDEVPRDRLLLYRPGDGWEPLCNFLACDVPDTSYPKVNSTEDFRKARG